MIKKKLPFVLVFFYLGTLVSSLLVHGEDQTTPNILLRQALSSIEKADQKVSSLEQQLGDLSLRTITLKTNLQNRDEKLGVLDKKLEMTQNQLQQSSQDLTTANQQLLQLGKTLATQETTLKEASNSLTKLEWESRLLKFGGSILLGAVVVGGLVLLVGGK